MGKNTNESADYVDIEDLYVSVGKSLATANRVLEKNTEEIYYAVVESEISIPYQGITNQEGRIRIKLPELTGTTEGLPKINFKIKPVPRVTAEAEEPIEDDLPVSVPRLVKLPLDEALTSLVSAGLRPGKIVYDPRAKPSGTIISQGVDSGQEVKLSTKVDLYVAGESLKIEIPAESVRPKVTKKPRPRLRKKRKKTKKR
ncbi:hypothetical protein ES707_21322 [subsurface metagenome]